VLPRHVGQQFLYSGQVLLWNPDGKPISVAIVSVPPAMSVRVGQVTERDDQLWLRVECRPAETGKTPFPAEVRIPVRARCDGKETTFELPILFSGNPS
jgi:hypothetical protein